MSWPVCGVQIIALLHEDTILTKGFNKQTLKCKTGRAGCVFRGSQLRKSDNTELLERNIFITY